MGAAGCHILIGAKRMNKNSCFARHDRVIMQAALACQEFRVLLAKGRLGAAARWRSCPSLLAPWVVQFLQLKMAILLRAAWEAEVGVLYGIGRPGGGLVQRLLARCAEAVAMS